MSSLPIKVDRLEQAIQAIPRMHEENKESRREDRTYFKSMVDEVKKECKELAELVTENRIDLTREVARNSVIGGGASAVIAIVATEVVKHLIK